MQARKDIKTSKHAKHVSPWTRQACKHAKHASMQVRKHEIFDFAIKRVRFFFSFALMIVWGADVPSSDKEYQYIY